MKKMFLFFVLSVPFTFLSCKKSSDSPPATTTSQWTFNGGTYTDKITSYVESTNELFANDNNGNFVRVFFSSIGKPSKSGTLTVLDYATTFTNATQCSLQVGNLYGTNPIQPLSTGKAGDVVILTVSSSGKLTASFSAITVTDGTTEKTVSGKIIEQ